MPNFRTMEKERYRTIKHRLFSDYAQQPGIYKKVRRDFCLHENYSAENLHESIRDPAISYFRERRIPWHDGLEKNTLHSNHLCCSQCCCVNFLFPMASNPALLKATFNHLYPEINIKKVLPFTLDGSLLDESPVYMAFEWIGEKDYLGEQANKNSARTRGANYTSADFAFRYESKDRKTHIMLGEWKYTEEYGIKSFLKPVNTRDKKPETRHRTYKPFFEKPNGSFSSTDDDLYRGMFFDPFYQLMRLQLLAQEMEASHEMGAHTISVLYISPNENHVLNNRITSAYLEDKFRSRDVYSIWKSLLVKGRFIHLATEKLLGYIDKEQQHADDGWVNYIQTRYGWKN